MSNSPSTVAGGAPPGPVQSVDRALTVLEILARQGDAGVTEVGLELGVHKSTAFRLLAALESRGFVEQSAERGTYRLGFAVVRLAGAAVGRLDLGREGSRACELLAAALGETVNLAVLSEGWAINLSEGRGAASVASRTWVGQRTPLHATSSGKVLLAYAPVEVRAGALAGPLERYTPATITDPDLLADALAKARVDGWAWTEQEYEIGLNAVAAPVRGADGSVLAALSAAGPAYRLTPASFEAIAADVVAAANDVSQRLGFFG